MYFNVIEAEYLGQYRIRMLFEDNASGIADLSGYISKGKVFKPFADISYFGNFKLENGTLTWGNGELDIAPEALYTAVTGKPIKYSRSKLPVKFELRKQI
jgi:hypothetical protein